MQQVNKDNWKIKTYGARNVILYHKTEPLLIKYNTLTKIGRFYTIQQQGTKQALRYLQKQHLDIDVERR